MTRTLAVLSHCLELPIKSKHKIKADPEDHNKRLSVLCAANCQVLSRERYRWHTLMAAMLYIKCKGPGVRVSWHLQGRAGGQYVPSKVG